VSKELEIWQFAAEKLKAGNSAMLLAVAESSGSSPGRQGFKMIVAGGEICGSIGGGVMEVNLVEQARQALMSDGPTSFSKQQTHRKNAEYPSGMICSGKQTVVFYKLYPSHLETVKDIIQALEKNEHKVLRITRNKFGLAIAGEEPPEGGTQNDDPADFLYQEKLGHKNKLFIIGGGHCALALSELMSKIDFHISLFDDRPNLNTIEKNKYVHVKNTVGSYENIESIIASGENNYVVVMTLGYKSDEVVIRKLLGKKFKYFGVLGSKAKMATLLRELEKEGFSREKLNRMHTPIGLPINSQTPEEIAVSIAAEIIAVKNSAK
jgi:xanthine dehydrogenase accessory factor